MFKKKPATKMAQPLCAHSACETPVIALGEFYCSKHTITNTNKEESTMTNKVNELKEKGIDTLNTVKGSSVWTTVSTAVKTAYTWTKEKLVAGIHFLGERKTAIAVGSTSAVAGGLVTASCGTALAVGVGVASLVVMAATFMAKKKEARKEMWINLAVATGTVAVLPLLLLVGTYVGVFATVFGFALPYSIIIA